MISFVMLLTRSSKQYKTVKPCRKDVRMCFIFYCCQHKCFHVRVTYIFSPILTKFEISRQTFVKSSISYFAKMHLLETN